MTSRPAYLSAKERREVTVETVIDLAAEQNPADITTGAIAKRMGVTQGALFRHFPTKDAILQTVMQWVSERLLARIDNATSTAASSLGALEAAFMAHIEFISEHPGVPRMLFGELQHAEQTMAKRITQTLIQRYGERLGRLIAEGKKCGELAATLDDKAAVTLFIGTIQGLVMQSLIAGDIRHIRSSAPGAFALYRRAVEAAN